MSLNAIAIPVPADKKAAWQAFVDDLNGRWKKEYRESRERAGLHERAFLQETPMGSIVIVTHEGDDAEHAFQRIVANDDEFTRWFLDAVKEVHGVDLRAPMPAEALPRLIADSRG
jgi:hypothetical protein